MSDSEDIYDAPMAPASAQSGKVSQLARAFESCLKQPIMPQPDFKQLPPKTKSKMLIMPSGLDKVPDMERARAKLRPVSIINNKQQPEVTQSNDDQTESAQRPLPEPAAASVRHTDDKHRHTRSLRKHSARESMFPPEVGAATVEKCSRYSQSTSGADTSSAIRTPYGSFRMLALPPPDGAAAPDKPEIIDVDLEEFRRPTSAIYDVTSDDIYDNIAADDVSGDSFVRSDVSRLDSRIVSTIPDMTEEEERIESGSRGTIFETTEEAEQEYDDITHQDGEIYHDIK